MNRLDSVFQNRKTPALAIYTVVGYPTQESTAATLQALGSSDADIIELGMPFSDPVADGPVIQKAHYDSLNNGTTMKEIFSAAKMLQNQQKAAVVLMGYLNPVLAYGLDRFLTEAAKNGVDGVILPDMPPEEYERIYRPQFEENGIKAIFLVSPNTPEARIKYLDSLSKGFLYAVSSLAITGSSNQDNSRRAAYLERLASYKLKNPIMVGFGISNREDFNDVTHHAQGAIVGSAFVKMLASGSTNDSIQSFVRQFR